MSQAAILFNIKENEWCKLEKMENFRPNFRPLNFFSWVLSLLAVRHCSKLSSKEIWKKHSAPNWRKRRKTNFWAWFWLIWCKFGSPNSFSRVFSLLDVRHCRPLLLYEIWRKTYNPNSIKWKKKNSFWS